MREYFTIMIHENSKENLGLLTEKLNDGFFIDDRISVGKSVLMVLQKRVENNSGLELSEGHYGGSIAAQTRY